MVTRMHFLELLLILVDVCFIQTSKHKSFAKGLKYLIDTSLKPAINQTENAEFTLSLFRNEFVWTEYVN